MSVNITGGGAGITIETDPTALKIANNLFDIPDPASARSNLGITIGIPAYDNYKTYSAEEQVLFADKFYKFNGYVGAAGYAPDTNPEYWTELSGNGGGGSFLPLVGGTIADPSFPEGQIRLSPFPDGMGNPKVVVETNFNDNISSSELGAGSLSLTTYGVGTTTITGSGIVFPDNTTQYTAFTGAVNIQTFGSSVSSGIFVWTKPANAKFVDIWLWSAGAGGGSGARMATTSARCGGAGGVGGTMLYTRVNANQLGGTMTVTVGGGGAGGAGQGTNSNAGNSGIQGGQTTFGPWRAVSNQSFTPAGWITTATANTAYTSQMLNSGFVYGLGGNGNTTTGSSASSNTSIAHMPTGGGGGAGASGSSTTNAAGGAGGPVVSSTTIAGHYNGIAGGSGGTVAGTQATTGTTASSGSMYGGTGGGGGFYRTGVNGGYGGNGGWPGGGGGGGGASDNGFMSGTGGNGANGFAIIISYS